MFLVCGDSCTCSPPSELDNLFPVLDVIPGCVSGVDNDSGQFNNPLVVDTTVGCNDQDTIRMAHNTVIEWIRMEGSTAHVESRHVGIVVEHRRAALPPSPLNWLGDRVLAMHALILADVWKTSPFAALILLAGLQMIPEELYEAARVDGAGRWQIFRRITLPLLLPFILIAFLFRTLDAFRIFDLVYVLTGGGPANTTETLSLYAYKLLFQTLQFGYGSAVAVITFLTVLLISAVCILLVRRQHHG